MASKPVGHRMAIWRTVLQQLPLWVWLVVLWMILWQSVSVLTIVSGIVLAIVAVNAFYLPAVQLSGRFNAGWFIVLVLRLAVELVVASLQVAWLAIRPKAPPRSAIVACELHTRSDFVLTIVTIAISVVPGSLVVEVDRENSIMYVHALDVESDTDVEKTKRHVLSIEALAVRAAGSRIDQLRLAHAERKAAAQ